MTSIDVDRASWAPPPEFAEYRMIRRLGEGGMGQVWLAHDTALDRMVAVKFLSGELERSPTARERFLVEARAAARVQHPNVVAVYRIGALGARPYIVSELIDGTPLSRLERPLPSARVLELGVGLARGLAAAHRRGVLHRDLKPANAILADDGQVKLLDFGLAKLLERPAAAPPAARRSGTSAYDVPTRPLDLAAEVSGDPDAARVSGVSGASGVSGVSGRSGASGTPTPRLGSEPPPAELTALGAVMGTPYYMSPETWLGEPATRASDVYALGVVLHELCAGRPPHADIAVAGLAAIVPTIDVPPVMQTAPGVDPRLAEVIDRCLQLDPARRYAGGEEVLLALEAARTADVAPSAAGNPYRGLHRFEADHRALFFGRATEVRAIVERLRHEALLVVAGDSGVGKSSLCRAGVLPAILDEGLGDGRAWTAARLVPGPRPMAALRAALELPATGGHDSTVVLGGAAPQSSREQLVRQVAAARRGRGLVIFVDQLEELVTLADRDEALEACRLLAELGAGVPGVRVLATARCDFLTRLSGLPDMGPALARGLYLVRPMAADALRAAVVGPARAAGVAFDPPAIVDELVADAAAADGGLPLLQFTLGELWEAHDRERRAITRDVLEQVGGLHGALTRHADRVIAALLPAQQAQARAVLMRAVSGQRTRARRTEDELTHGEPAARAALDALVRGRLLAAQAGEAEPTYEVAHEALLSGWRTLRDWLDERADQRAAHERLAGATSAWLGLGRARDGLWGARALADAALVPAAELTVDQRAFLAASRREGARGRWRRRVVVAAIVAAAAVGTLGYRSLARRARDRRVAAYVTAGELALAEARAGEADLDALRARAFATFDGGERDDGERLWLDARAAGDRVSASYRAAGRSFEAAVTVDNHAARARALLADTLYRRAILAERDRKDAERDEALDRLRLYDDGHRAAAWSAPAHLAITSSPPGARLAIAPVTAGEPRGLGPWRPLGATPFTHELPPGSYVVELTLDGRAPARLPVLVERGETLTADVPLPAAGAVPADMVYVPPGRFLAGSAAPDRFRASYLKAAPPHAVTTTGFLIARHETTVGEWAAFLDALPPDRAARHAPSVGSPGEPGFVRLAREHGAWQLALQPASEPYAAQLDGELRYRHRPAEAPHAAARLPVTGVSPVDALAYAAWLDATGRVPGARLCREVEWERAARGAGDRAFPHGDVLRPDDANYGEAGSDYAGYGLDEVGRHPASRSVFGLDDLAGNAWELARSSFDDTTYVVRGGGYPLDEQAAMSTMRDQVHDQLRDASIGLRICADLAQ